MSVTELAKSLKKTWAAIDKAGAEADQRLQKIRELVAANNIDSADISVVAFGSLARREWTSGSDLDWTMLIDGEAEHEHANTAHKLEQLLLEAGFAAPGKTGTFGTLTFSHGLIHEIGGLDDTNRNTTRRLLLLLESRGANRRDAYDRVIRGILRRYLQNDFRDFRLKVPRFLLNDLQRFWRTMCVDYASKYREQAGDKWAIRNVKLRMSRKLIFASGLLTCYSCDEKWIEAESRDLVKNPTVAGLVDYLLQRIARTPLDIVADGLMKHGDSKMAALICDAYDSFLERLDDAKTRKHLEQLLPENAAKDGTFQELQAISKRFEDGLERFFFDSEKLGPLTRAYGVF